MTVSVRVCASTSNLGAGFDCIGVAVERRLRVLAHVGPARGTAPVIERLGTLAELAVPASEDFVVRGFAAACEYAHAPVPRGLVMQATSDIPIARGLGSSAAAIVAGALVARALLELPLDDLALMGIATTLEGHPDNVAPALYGGATLAFRTAQGGWHVAPLTVHPALRFVFAVPDFPVGTDDARAALPAQVSHDDARQAAAASAALVAGLARADATLLSAGLEGRLHVPYRKPFVRGYDAVVAAARQAGAAGATLSGSGSSVVAVTTDQTTRAVADGMAHAWHTLGVHTTTFTCIPSRSGYRCDVTTLPGGDPFAMELEHTMQSSPEERYS